MEALHVTDVEPDNEPLHDQLYQLLRELRPQLTKDAFVALTHAATQEGLTFTVAINNHGRCVGLATHRILTTSPGPNHVCR